MPESTTPSVATRDTLYQRLVDIGAELDHRESDLYVLYTAETLDLVRSSGLDFATFVSQIDNRTWIEVPFAYIPFWTVVHRNLDRYIVNLYR